MPGGDAFAEPEKKERRGQVVEDHLNDRPSHDIVQPLERRAEARIGPSVGGATSWKEEGTDEVTDGSTKRSDEAGAEKGEVVAPRETVLGWRRDQTRVSV
jgi:hypothetical protein